MLVARSRRYLFVFFVCFLSNKLSLGQLSLQDGNPVILHVVLIFQSLSYPETKYVLYNF